MTEDDAEKIKGETPVEVSEGLISVVNKKRSLLEYDEDLGLSYRKSLSIAFDILNELTLEEKTNLNAEIFDVFWKWKDEHGVYPPQRSVLFRLSGNVQQEKAVDYERRMREASVLAGKDYPKMLLPWQCDNYADTPYKLFNKLLSEKYEPLAKFMKQEKIGRYDYVLADIISLTYSVRPKDSIEAALELAEFRLSIQKDVLESAKPIIDAGFMRRKMHKQSMNARKENTEKTILEHYYFLKESGLPSNVQEIIALDLGISQATVSRHLKNNGLNKNQKKLS